MLATSVSVGAVEWLLDRGGRELAIAEAEPQADLNASVEYRTHLAKVLTRRALQAATN